MWGVDTDEAWAMRAVDAAMSAICRGRPGWARPIGGSVMTTPDRAASPARRDAASASIPDQLPLAMLQALLLVPGNHRLRSPPPTFDDAR
jgi:hypothetical protein